MLLGLFVGGRARRMGGYPKGLLPAPDGGEPLVVRLARLGTELGLEPALIGDAEAYRAALPGLRWIADRPGGIGPLGGLAGLLEASGSRPAVALACDLPYLSRGLLARIAHTPTTSAVLAPRPAADFWDPLCARYHAPRVLPVLSAAIAAGTRSFQQLLGGLTVEQLPLTDEERAELRDWDAPEDVPLSLRPARK